MTACLDSWAVLAWLRGNPPAAERVEEILESRPRMSWINAIEVYYRIERDHGRPKADEYLARLREELDFELPGVVRMIEVAHLKARLPIALADCFAVATAAAHDLALWTGDPEILERKDLPCQLVDLRQG